MTTYPNWVFDDTPIDDPLGHGARAVEFFEALRHPLSVRSERRFGLPRFWQRIIKRIYGPRDEQGRRVVRTVFMMIPRGARKTATIGGGLGLLHAVGHERVPSGQVLLGAGSEDQAELAFDEAVGIVRATPALRQRIKIRGDYLEHIEGKSTLRVLSAEGDVAHGTTPAAAFLDELHIWKNRKLWRALKTGMLKTPGALLCITTTAGRGQTGLAWEEYQYACKVARGELTNPHYLPIIFEPPTADADWLDEDLWHLVNPGLAEGFPVLEEMRAAALEAKDKPSEADEFRQYNLNFWLDSSSSPFVDMAGVYDKGNTPVDLDAMEKLPCWIGVDLSSNTDLTAVVACWRQADRYFVAPWFFCPKENLEERQDRTQAPYTTWAAEGLITTTEGNVVDYAAVENKIIDLCERFDVREIAFDPHMARQVQPKILDAGLPAVDFRQVPSLMMPALVELERALLGRQLQHGGHAVLRFCFANAEVERNRQGHLVRFVKPRKWMSIDGAVATAMAIRRASEAEVGNWLNDADAVERLFSALR